MLWQRLNSISDIDGLQKRGEKHIITISKSLQFEQITNAITKKQHWHYRIHKGKNMNPGGILHYKLVFTNLRKYIDDHVNSLQQQTICIGDSNMNNHKHST